MKRILTFGFLILISALLVSCIETIPVDDVESIEIQNWTAQELYQRDDPVDLSNASVKVIFSAASGKSPQTFNINDEELLITGTGSIENGRLKTDYDEDVSLFIKVAYSGVSVTINYKVVEHLVYPGELETFADNTLPTLEDATVYIAEGEHFLSNYIIVENPVTFTGPEHGTASITITENSVSRSIGGSSYPALVGTVFNVLSPNVTINNLTLQVASNIREGGTYKGIIHILNVTSSTHFDAELDPDDQSVAITNNVIRGLFETNILFFHLYTQGIRFDNANCGHVLIQNNEIYNLRTGISLNSGLNTDTTIINNNIYHTKGGILTSGTKENVTRIMGNVSGNTFESNSDGFLSHNEWDIVVISGDAFLNRYERMEFIESVYAKNPTAYILDRRGFDVTGYDPLDEGVLDSDEYNVNVTRNQRSVAFIVDEDDRENYKENINSLAYYSNATLMDKLTPGCDPVLGCPEIPAYQFDGLSLLSNENWWTDLGAALATGDRGGNRDFYWKPATSLEMAYDAIIYGGTIYQWNSTLEDWEEVTIDWDDWAVASGFDDEADFITTYGIA